MRNLVLFFFWLVVILHFILVFCVCVGIFVLPFVAHWCIVVPLEIYMVSLLTTSVECPLTNLENVLRRKLGYKPIGGFVGFYMLKPIKRYIKGKK